jgi:hypothetical protein
MPMPAGKRDPHAQVLENLRTVFQEKLNVVPRDLGVAGAFAVAMKGVRVEVQPWPQWSVSIYNFNDVAAEQETESFKACLEIAAKALNIDLTQGAVKTETGKSYMKTTSSLGPISLVRDPATNNSCMIRPIQAQGQMGPPRPKAGPDVAPRPPKQPAQPVQPPRPPAKDEVF